MIHLPTDLQYECLCFLNWFQYCNMCTEMNLKVNFDRYFKECPIKDITIRDICMQINCDESILLELVKRVFSINSDTKNAIYYAASNGYVTIVDFLYNQSASFSDYEINLAIVNGHLNTAKYLCEHATSLIKFNFIDRNFSTVRYKTKNDFYINIFVQAFNNGYLDIVDYLYGIIPTICITRLKDYSIIYTHHGLMEYFFKKGEKYDLTHLLEYNLDQDMKIATYMLEVCKIDVKGLTKKELERRIHRRLKRDFVKLLSKHGMNFYK